MPEPPRSLLDLLAFEAVGDDTWLAPTPIDGWGRLFGGQVASQSLRAATLTVEPDRQVHSMHAYFIRPGRAGEPLLLEVDRTRDGRSFTTRRVTAVQGGEAIFVLAASFAITEDGEDWQLPAPTDVPSPDDLDVERSFFTQMWAQSPVDVRAVHESPANQPPQIHPLWIKTKATLPDDPVLHRCALAFFSDIGVVGSALAPETSISPKFGGASLDHAVWFHRPVRADEWILFSVDPVSNASARGLAIGTMHTRDGVLVASVAQEALLRGTGRVPMP